LGGMAIIGKLSEEWGLGGKRIVDKKVYSRKRLEVRLNFVNGFY